MKFDEKYFVEYEFTQGQIEKNLNNALRDLQIAKQDKIPEVKFNYSYSALIKAGIALLNRHRIKIKSVPGYHLKMLEKMAEVLKDSKIADMGNLMRSKRNLVFYGSGIEITETECRKLLKFTEKTLSCVRSIIST